MEGEKSVLEVLQSDFLVETLVVTAEFEDRHSAVLGSFRGQLIQATQNQLEDLGQFQSNDSSLAVVQMKDNAPFLPEGEPLILALDDVRDPGNLGTIIRLADWYGINKLVFSSQTADFYNPKVIQSTMGSFTRVKFFYADLATVFDQWALPVYGAFLGGESIHGLQSPQPGVLLMGNESKGISSALEKYVTKRVTIPGFGQAESLNVAIATAILCDNFKRLMGS